MGRDALATIGLTSAEAGRAIRDRLLSANAPQHTGGVSFESVQLSTRLIELADQPRCSTQVDQIAHSHYLWSRRQPTGRLLALRSILPLHAFHPHFRTERNIGRFALSLMGAELSNRAVPCLFSIVIAYCCGLTNQQDPSLKENCLDPFSAASRESPSMPPSLTYAAAAKH